MAHLHTTQFLDQTPYDLKRLRLTDVEFILKVRTQILKNRQTQEQERIRQKQIAELEKLKRSLR